MSLTGAFSALADTGCAVGESPLWDAARGALLWVDIPVGEIHELTPATGARRRWRLEGPVGSIGLAADGRLVVARRHEVGLLERATGVYETLAQVLPPDPELRLNDGKVGPDGAFWVGSMHDALRREPRGALFRITPEGRVERRRDGLFTSNGLAWSADGRAMFHSDSRGCWIERWDFDPATGAMSGQTRIATPGEADGRPDGGAVDAKGYYWSAGVSAGCLNRYAPDGKLDQRIPVPVPAPTMPCFGGDGRLYVTSLRPADGVAGPVLVATATVTGAPCALFAAGAL